MEQHHGARDPMQDKKIKSIALVVNDQAYPFGVGNGYLRKIGRAVWWSGRAQPLDDPPDDHGVFGALGACRTRRGLRMFRELLEEKRRQRVTVIMEFIPIITPKLPMPLYQLAVIIFHYLEDREIGKRGELLSGDGLDEVVDSLAERIKGEAGGGD